MKHLYFLMVLLLSMAGQGLAQQPVPAGLRISTNLFSLHEPDGGPSLAAELRYSKYWSIGMEGTWILYDLGHQYAPMAKGYRLRPEMRFYLPGKRKGYKMFFAAELLYKQVTFLEERIVDQGDDGSGNHTYEQLMTFEREKRMFGGACRFGFQAYWGAGQRFFFEASGGLGLKYRYLRYKQVPPADSRPVNSTWINGDETLPYAPISIRLGYRF